MSSVQLATGVATGFCLYVTSAVTVLTVDTGLAGSGAGAGQGLVLAPPALSGPLVGFMAGAGLLGPFSPPTAVAIGLGLSAAFGTASVVTVHAGVGSGAGAISLVPNGGASLAAFQAGFAAAGLNGIMSKPMAAAIAGALDVAIPTVKGAVAIVGSAGTAPASGAGTGKVL